MRNHTLLLAAALVPWLMSLDGKTWEVNWMNDLTRADPAKICDGVHPRS